MKIPHPEWVRGSSAFDISLLATSSPIWFTDNVQPISLGTNFVGGGVNAVVAGFGFWRNVDPVNSPILQYLRTTTLTNADCSYRLASTNLVVRDHSICTFSGVDQGFCFRDNGGGLVADGVLIAVAR
jgi:hypothetical protein